MNRIYNDNDLIDIREMNSLVNTTSYHKKFCFSRHDVYFIMNYLDNWTITDIVMTLSLSIRMKDYSCIE